MCYVILNLKVLTWLLSAEDGLQGQPPISDNVEEVKEQFHTHEVRARAVQSAVTSDTIRTAFSTGNNNSEYFALNRKAPHYK